ncbi:TOM1-like protein 5 isoform X1 [Actinidia eriantha]|uniref:TOM1-like protein 5 isoform X1 n=1 Tax=Actinidia eriantha TaxID=165200 RepID=UPI002586BE93|nr:TOM1-like protein 5 isoform X1 [Actinidia eriantha]
MAAELVNSATGEKLTEMDWMKNIQICELVVHDQRQAKDAIKAIKKRLSSKNSNTQLFAVSLLEMLMNNIGDHIHRQVIDTGILPILVKIVKKKSDSPVREKIFLLLDATQTSLGGASGKFPQYYSAYYDLVNAGVQFPQRTHAIPSNRPLTASNNNVPGGEPSPSRPERPSDSEEPRAVPESSIIKKTGSALEVLREVLDAVDTQHPEGAKDEFTLDLVEQCSFQKQRVMHLAMTSRVANGFRSSLESNRKIGGSCVRLPLAKPCFTCCPSIVDGFVHPCFYHAGVGPTWEKNGIDGLRFCFMALGSLDEKMVSRAIDLNEKLEKLLARHDALISGRSTSSSNNLVQEEPEEEEEAEQLFRRMRKGKACARPEDEERQIERPLGLLDSPNSGERLHRLLIRPLSVEPSQEINALRPTVSLPPPPAKHMEREKFFQENKLDGSGLSGHVRGLSLHSHNGSGSYSGSMDSD